MIHYWLQAVHYQLTTASGIPITNFIDNRQHNIKIMPDGKPSAVGGNVFIAVHPGSSFNPVADNYGDTEEETYEIFCTVSQRTRNAPEDKVGNRLFYEDTVSLTRAAYAVRQSVANVSAIKTDVISMLDRESESGSVTELLRWSRTSQPVPRDKSWFMSSDPYDMDLQPAGYSCEVVFVGGTIIRGTGC